MNGTNTRSLLACASPDHEASHNRAGKSNRGKRTAGWDALRTTCSRSRTVILFRARFLSWREERFLSRREE
eukprot:3447836-Pleurochrysis_carterae.AAC.1